MSSAHVIEKPLYDRGSVARIAFSAGRSTHILLKYVFRMFRFRHKKPVFLVSKSHSIGRKKIATLDRVVNKFDTLR